jgi:seryl-tRNA synthetase
MPGLVPGIHVLSAKAWMAGTRPAMTAKEHATMHDIRWIQENPEAFDIALNKRNLSEEEKKDFSSQNLISIDDRRRARIRTLESWQAKRNAASKSIGQAKAKRDEVAVRQLMAEVAECKESISTLEGEVKEAEGELKRLLERIPNLPLEEVPHGTGEADNVEEHKYWPKREIKFAGFGPKQHFDLGEALGQMDFETAARLSGARFVVLKKGLARLERALGQFMLDVHTSDPHNYTEIAPPLLVRDEVMFGTAQLPKFEEDQFYTPHKSELDRAAVDELRICVVAIEERRKKIGTLQADLDSGAQGKDPNFLKREIFAYGLQISNIESRIRAIQNPDRLWLIPTAEVPLTNLVRESIVDEAQLPMRLTACTPCFRAEAGAAGKDTRGMIRQHQFTKVELVSITTPEQSKDEHERMLSCAEEILRRLDLHYRVMTLSTGDMGFASQKTYDIEVWLPGQNMYREISSCSVCGEFQARRMNARYRTKEGRQVRHVHTLNGSGVAVGRALIAVMESYQQEDGSIAVPDALVSYMGGMKKIEKH